MCTALCPARAACKEFFDVYQHIPYEVDEKGENKTQPNSAILAHILSNHGLCLDDSRQSIEGMEIFPQEYFCAIDQATRQIIVTPNTYTIHYLSGSWFSKKLRLINKTKRIVGKVFGYKTINVIRRILGK